MKKILIVIPDMGMGGAQKSLLSFLQCLSGRERRKEYEINLMVAKPSGAFYTQIPDFVHMVTPPKELQWLGTKMGKDLFVHRFSFRGLIGKLSWILRNRLGCFRPKQNLQQKLWDNWKCFVPVSSVHYDVAISYMDGFTNYYVIDKVSAGKKVLWVHNEYQKIEYDPTFDQPYYDRCSQIITISEKCRRCIMQAFPQHGNKVHVLENISSSQAVADRSREVISTEYCDCPGWKLLSVGRLNPQKGFDMAIDAAAQLRELDVDFRWIIVGEGLERENLQSKIDQYGLKDHVRLVGEKANPYVYMRNCDMLIQSSRFEGKSIVLDEAKILNTCIIATEYATVRDSVAHGETGWIVEMTPDAIAQGILHLMQHPDVCEKMRSNLQHMEKGNEGELQKYMLLMF